MSRPAVNAEPGQLGNDERLRTVRSRPAQGLDLDLATGAIYRDGEQLRVTEGTLALMTLLVVAARPLAGREICELLWPESRDRNLSNALKTGVYRARTQLGKDAVILTSDGAYRLGELVSSNLELIGAFASQPANVPVENDDRARLEDWFWRLVRGQIGGWAPWQWFAGCRRSLAEACAAIGLRLVRDAIERGDSARALKLVRGLAAAVPQAFL